MPRLLKTKPQKKTDLNDEFANYVKQQRVITTFNGMEIAEFSSYKKLLGLK